MLTFDDLIPSQKMVMLETLEAVNNNEHVTISGPPGSGKTLLTRFIYEALVEIYGEDAIFVAAPTHQAKNVLNETIGRDCANTIHSILKINPETFEDSVEFIQSEIPDFSGARVLICDEASMYGDDLFKVLIATVPKGCSIIGVGDKDQLSPTTSKDVIIDLNKPLEISRFFVSKAFKNLELTETIRNDDKTVEVALVVRDGGELFHNVGKFGGVYQTENVKDFFSKYFSIVKKHEDFESNRIVAYANKTVDRFNAIARKMIYKTEEPFIVGETLVMQEPIIKNFTVKGKKKATILYNNGERVTIVGLRKNVVDRLNIPTLSQGVDIEFWELTIKSLDNPTTQPEKIRIIVREDMQKTFGGYLSLYASTCRAMRAQGNKKVPWADFWKVKGLFKNVKPLAASTIHKSQGTTNENTFLYTPCMYTSYELHKDVIRQLKYVGLTRSKKYTFYL